MNWFLNTKNTKNTKGAPRTQKTNLKWSFFCVSLCALCVLCVDAVAKPAFRPALPGYKFQFPRDHGSHPEYQTEWWYYTGHLRAADGHRFGYQLTFFRTALTPSTASRTSKWAVRDVIFSHFALSDIDGKRFYNTDRISRAALQLAGADRAGTKSPRVWIDNWAMRFGGRSGETQTLSAAGEDSGTPFSLSLTQRALKPPVVHGTRGVSQKSPGAGHASHYYSFTRLATRGTVRLGSEVFAVTGQSWFDHEFGSNQMTPNQTGWDWFSLQLADGRELMLYQLRLNGGKIEPLSSGTLVEKDGTTRHLKLSDFVIEPLSTWRSPHTKGVYPAKWRLKIPRRNIELEVSPLLADQELLPKRGAPFNYWEGAVEVSGTQRGEGYVEMTGYSAPMGGAF